MSSVTQVWLMSLGDIYQSVSTLVLTQTLQQSHLVLFGKTIAKDTFPEINSPTLRPTNVEHIYEVKEP